MAENAKMEELNLTINVKVSADFRSLTWVRALVRIQGLQGLSLQAKQHSDDEVSIQLMRWLRMAKVSSD